MKSIFILLVLLFLGAANTALLTPHEIHLAHDLRTSIFAIDLVMFLYMAVPAFFLPVWVSWEVGSVFSPP